MLLRTGPSHFFGEVLKWGRDIVSVCTSTFSGSKTGKLDPIRTQKRKTSSPIFQIDAKVRALSAMQFGLATAVGEVHRNAGVVAAAWGTSAEKFDNESLRSMLSDSLHDLLGSLEGVSASKATLPSGASQDALHEAHSGKVPQSPLSKAVNTEFTARKSARKQHDEYRTPSPVFMKTPEASSASGSLAEEGFADVWRLVNLLKDEGTKASLSAKKILAAHKMPEKWQRRWVLYGALASAVGEFHWYFLFLSIEFFLSFNADATNPHFFTGTLSLYTIRHSRLCGSSDLDQLLQRMWSGLLRFWRTHAETPWRSGMKSFICSTTRTSRFFDTKFNY